MEVILKEDVANLGHRGDVVKVADGYGRNFLLPRKLALQATLANKAVIEQMKAAAARRSATEKAQAEELVTKLEPVVLAFTRKSGENGQLFGSVTSADIAGELATKGFDIDRRKIQLNEPLKALGNYDVTHQAAPRSDREAEGARDGRDDGGGRSARRDGRNHRRIDLHIQPPFAASRSPEGRSCFRYQVGF